MRTMKERKKEYKKPAVVVQSTRQVIIPSAETSICYLGPSFDLNLCIVYDDERVPTRILSLV